MNIQLLPQDLKIYLKLATLAQQGRIPHAMMCHGRQGSSKLLLALKFSQYIVCENKQGNEICGICPACIKSTKMIHPDIHYVFPVIKKEGKKRMDTVSNDFLPEWRSLVLSNPYVSIRDWMKMLGADNNQPNINTKECNEIIQKLNLQSYESSFKILIIWLPEFLGKEGNRLLKIIEEPTDDTFILLIAEDLTRILGTILSRTQLISVPPVRDDEMIQVLKDDYHLESTRASQIVSLADGDMGAAIRMINTASQDYSQMLFQWIRRSYKSKPEDLTSLINDMANLGREEQKNFLQYGLSFFREYLFLIQTRKRGPRLTEEEYDIALKMQSIIDMEKCYHIVELLDENILNISRNAHPKITFMAMSMQMGALLKGEDLSPVNI
jgi:DNA polymerase-3 subunit delta'